MNKIQIKTQIKTNTNKIIKFNPLKLSNNLILKYPIILAPMAGITHYPFRKICREFGDCLTISEMVTARSYVENSKKALSISEFGPDESPRSIQLYGVDPIYIAKAVKILVSESKVDHIDLNFGCPVKKITRRGGGAALPYKTNLLKSIIQAAVKNSENIPVTVKCRMGIDQEHLTYLDTGYIAQEEGCAAISLHARTAAQMYAGIANWSAIKNLKSKLKHIPVLGNGDIFTAQNALDMLKFTNCDGIVIGRGCLGRPWLFQDLNNIFNNNTVSDLKPDLNQVINIMLRHLDYMISWFGEKSALLKFRKEACYYLKGFKNSTKIKTIIMQVTSYTELQDLLYKQNILDLNEPFPDNIINQPKGKTGRSQIVSLPYGFLDSKICTKTIDKEAELNISGG